MREKQSALNDIILASIHDNQGQTLAKTIDTVFGNIPTEMKPPSRETIRRRIHELGARGYLILRDEIVVCPREKNKPKRTRSQRGNEDPSDEEGS
jgi:hypothetical protein